MEKNDLDHICTCQAMIFSFEIIFQIMISALLRQIVVMMGTVVIFFFACLLPFKVVLRLWWLIMTRLVMILTMIEWLRENVIQNEDTVMMMMFFSSEGVDHVGCHISIWNHGHLQHRGKAGYSLNSNQSNFHYHKPDPGFLITECQRSLFFPTFWYWQHQNTLK